MAEAQQNSSKPVTTAAFIESMNKVDTGKPSSTTPLQALQNSSNDTSSMNHLSDSDLQTLLQNFKDLSNEEQHSLINYLKKLESTEPERVERLRKFVNVGNEAFIQEEIKETGRISPFSLKLGKEDNFDDFEEEPIERKEDVMPPPAKVNIVDSEDEEYSYEDVFKAATKNVTQKEEELRKREEVKKKDFDLINAKTIIANLMGNVSNKKSNTDFSGGEASSNLTNTLNNLPVNMENIANIVGKIQNLQPVNLDNGNSQTTQHSKSNIEINASNKSNTNLRPTDYQQSNQGQDNYIRYPNLQNYSQGNTKPTMDFQSNTPNLQYSQHSQFNRSNFENVSYPLTNPYSARQPDRSQNSFEYNRYIGRGRRGNYNNANSNRTIDGW